MKIARLNVQAGRLARFRRRRRIARAIAGSVVIVQEGQQLPLDALTAPTYYFVKRKEVWLLR
jgi:hypothetical protein